MHVCLEGVVIVGGVERDGVRLDIVLSRLIR
jgi:hypothetical protein